MAVSDSPPERHCRCYLYGYPYGRCLVLDACPTADRPALNPLTDETWRKGYAKALEAGS